MLAAANGRGHVTIIYNAAKEPHIVDLANFLNSMGARVKGAGTDVIRITGQPKPARHHLHRYPRPDRDRHADDRCRRHPMATSPFTAASPRIWKRSRPKLLEMGIQVNEGDDIIRVRAHDQHRAINIKTQVYPGFPTDLQQPITALLCMANGQSTVYETIFEQRFKHLDELTPHGRAHQADGPHRAHRRRHPRCTARRSPLPTCARAPRW